MRHRPAVSKETACARKTPLHPERSYPHARIRVFHHSGPEIPGSAREGKPRSFFLCLELEHDPGALESVERLRQISALIKESLEDFSLIELTASQRESIL